MLNQAEAMEIATRRITSAKFDRPRSLSLSGFDLAQLPESLFDLVWLRELDLSRNCLTELPDAFSSLTQLVRLDLRGNQLTRVPQAILDLPELAELDLSGNQLTVIPSPLGGLKSLNISGNHHLRFPPPGIVKLGDELVLTYLQEHPAPEAVGDHHIEADASKPRPKGPFRKKSLVLATVTVVAVAALSAVVVSNNLTATAKSAESQGEQPAEISPPGQSPAAVPAAGVPVTKSAAAAAVSASRSSPRSTARETLKPSTVSTPVNLPVIASQPAAPLVTASSPSPEPKQPWIIGYHGLCLDAYGSIAVGGNPIYIDTCGADDGESWTVEGDGSIQHAGLCLDVLNAGMVSGTLVQLFTCNTTPAQHWQATGGTLVNPISGLCLDDTGGATGPGTEMQIRTCDGSSTEQWQLP